VPDLHARRSRMRHGASQARIAGAEINHRVGKATGRERVRQACPPFHPAIRRKMVGTALRAFVHPTKATPSPPRCRPPRRRTGRRC
jgi:hypothetical protein